MAVPKKRKSKAKTRSRRTHNDRITAVASHPCPHCGAPKRAHRPCPECGNYGATDKAEQVIEVWEY